MIDDLPTHDIDEISARRIRAAAHAELRPSRWRRVWRSTELVIVGGLAAGYLFWALQAASLPYR